MRPKRLIYLAIALVFLLSGCAESASLYALPRTGVTDALPLETLEAMTAGDAQLLTPGDGCQLRQANLSGDDSEYTIAFLGDGNSNATLCILKTDPASREKPLTFSCAGTEISTVLVEDLTGDGASELLVLSGLPGVNVRTLQVYGVLDGAISELASEPCRQMELHDLDGDGIRELYCISDRDEAGQVLPYMAPQGKLLGMEPISLQFASERIASIQTGLLSDGTQALMISGKLEDGALYTELLACRDGQVGGLTQSSELLEGLLYTPVRGYYAYPQDIDGDGDTDFPAARELPRYDEGSTVQHVIDWYDFAESGVQGVSTVTYHNFSGLWYLKFPETWWTDITIRETDLTTTLSTVTIYRLTDRGAEEFLTVYEVQGDDRQEFVEEENLTILRSDTERTLALGLSRKAQRLDETVTTASIAERFFVLYEEQDISGNAE